MKISELIREDWWAGNDKDGNPIVNTDKIYWNGGKDPKHNTQSFTTVNGKTIPPGFFKNLKNNISRKFYDTKYSATEFVKHHPKSTAAVALGATALGIKKGVDAYKNNHSLAGQTKKFMDKNGKKVAAGTLAALGAGVGVKALLKYLRKKKRS